MPYMVIKTAGRLIGRSLTRNPVEAQPAPPAPAPAPAAVQPQGPAATPFATLVPANRVCSTEIGGQRVNFYQYFDAKVIRASCRANRILQEAMFTPAIAEECGIAFDLDGAIQWIWERGFNGPRAQSVKKASPQQPSPVANADIDQVAPPFDEPINSVPMARPGAVKAKGQKPAPSASAQTFVHTLVPADERQGRPFRGRILNFGEETRPARGEQKSYVTYVLRMESESGQYAKDFIGEHLDELVQQHNLSVGQLVTVQLVGKEHFEVEVNGKLEPRKRNHYSIKVH
jgi:hypothetical protein